MKLFGWIFLVNCLIASQMSGQTDMGGTIHFNTLDLDYGTIKKDSDPIRKFIVTNIGKIQLYISSCKATCGCTVPNCPQEPIQPSRSAIINVRYNTGRLGPFTKQITVYSSDSKNPVSILKIHGEVIE